MATIFGQITVNEIRVYEVDTDPSAGAGTPASVGSLAIVQSTGVMWRKYASGDTEWSPVVYGSNWQRSENAATVNNNSQTAYVSAVTLTTPSLPTGDYEIFVQGIYFHGTGGRQVQISVLRNTVEFANYIGYITANTSRELFSGKGVFTGINGIQTFDLQFRSVGNGTASLSNTSLIFKRVR